MIQSMATESSAEARTQETSQAESIFVELMHSSCWTELSSKRWLAEGQRL